MSALAVISFILNVSISLLLVATIYYCWRLNRRIRVLQDSKSELARLIRQFDETTDRASVSIIELQAIGKKVNEGIQARLEKANFIADDLSFMIEKANKLSHQMEAGISANRASRGAPPSSSPRAEAAQQSKAVVPTASPKLPNLGQQQAAPAKIDPQAARAAIQEKLGGGREAAGKATASIESVLERISGRNNNGNAPANTEQAAPAKKPNTMARLRSRAEQELLDAIKSGR